MSQHGNALLADTLAYRDRFGKFTCLSCGEESPFIQFGSPTLHCAHCGFTPAAGYGDAWFKAIATPATALAKVLADNDPVAKAVCGSCASEFPVRQFGRYHVICPYCGFTPTAQDCEAKLNAMAESRAKAANAARRAAAAATAARFRAALLAYDLSGRLVCASCGKEFAVSASGEPDMACRYCGFTLPLDYCEAWLAAKTNGSSGADTAAVRLAAVMLAEKTDATDLCFCCGRAFPIMQYGVPILVCPRCGRVRSEQECEAALKARVARLAEHEEHAFEGELAEAAKEIAVEVQPDRGQANGGYVYALLNSTIPGLVKIGKTERDPDERAKELSGATGIPTPFAVAYAEWFQDCSAAEDYVHALLEQKGFRVARNREFFCAPLKAAIQAIMKAKEREDERGSTLA